jgi:hypothetical protein
LNYRPEIGSYQTEILNYQPEAGSYQTEIGSYQPGTGSYQTEIGSYQPGIGSYQIEIGSYRIEILNYRNRKQCCVQYNLGADATAFLQIRAIGWEKMTTFARFKTK